MNSVPLVVQCRLNVAKLLERFTKTQTHIEERMKYLNDMDYGTPKQPLGSRPSMLFTCYGLFMFLHMRQIYYMSEFFPIFPPPCVHCPSFGKLAPIPAVVLQNVINKSCLVCVMSEKYVLWINLRPQLDCCCRGEAEVRILDFKTTWSEFQKASQTATVQGKVEQ